MKRTLCVLCLLLALALTFGTMAVSEAPLSPVIYGKVTAASASLYELPGEYRKVTTVLASGAQLYVEFEGTTWHKVKTVQGGYVGWLKASDMSITTRGYSALTYGSNIVGTKSVSSQSGQAAALRWGPGQEYDVMTELPVNTVVWVFDTSGDWTRVLLNDGRIGYVHTTLLKTYNSKVTFPDNLYGYVQVTGNSAIYRNGPSYSSKSLGTLSSGDVVQIKADNTYFWYFFNPAKNSYAYISRDILSPEGINRTAVQTSLYYDNPYLYVTDVLRTLQPGQVVKVLANDGYISRVQFDNVIGYVVNDTLVIHH